MTNIEGVMTNLLRDWETPRRAKHRGQDIPFLLSCRAFGEGVKSDALPDFGFSLPSDVVSFWSLYDKAELFVDTEYDQWGLSFLSPGEALSKTSNLRKVRRSSDLRLGDVAIATFHGDSDLLLIRCDEAASDFGSIVVALPIDKRHEWPKVADSLNSFLATYYSTEGDKFWE